MTLLDDQPARDAIAADLDSTFVVEAAAGPRNTSSAPLAPSAQWN